ncbi:hypothetical protein N7468_010631 [Penicillium chermesinum]|uniref:Uncharacterized protein n=1 Tax=Penicillium chermesinum TaxID=63820 RepID=A0A9W9T9X0_9EURO|nr:uncharacterized protein N7468_010631 [Penicillium chermesinum]KAJ5214952.1 hypothetical protein N7468_010631 [Penicillium chermesinum]
MTTAIPDSYGPYVLMNLGPVTTTFTPAPACNGPEGNLYLGRVDTGDYGSAGPDLQYTVNCGPSYPQCAPTNTLTPLSSQLSTMAPYGLYYSPGLHCPAGWETVAQAARDGEKPYTTSGIMSYGKEATENTELGAHSTYFPVILAAHLKPSETIAVCCPSGYKADITGGCWTITSSYKPTKACATPYTHGSATTEVTAYLVNYAGSTTSEETFSGTMPWDGFSTTTQVWSANDDSAESLTPIQYYQALTMYHVETDVQAAATATSTAASTSNGAARLHPRRSNWNEIGSILGVSLAAVVLGSAIIFQA